MKKQISHRDFNLIKSKFNKILRFIYKRKYNIEINFNVNQVVYDWVFKTDYEVLVKTQSDTVLTLLVGNNLRGLVDTYTRILIDSDFFGNLLLHSNIVKKCEHIPNSIIDEVAKQNIN